ncbi:MAG: CDP-2,3-bis-(O-geranylgeranyl)-sn-glycerol synthase [Halobacteriales archaeon]
MVALAAVIATAIWAMLPAYVPNNAAVLVGGGPPIDGGRSWRGRRLLGDGKTWRGTVGGIVAGALLAALLNGVVTPASTFLGVDFPSFPIRAAIGLPAGAMLGDITASFLKRRTGRERGAAFPGLDQLDFVLGALVIAALLAPGWTIRVFTLPVVVTVLIITPLLHVLTNVIAYGLGLKNEPW